MISRIRSRGASRPVVALIICLVALALRNAAYAQEERHAMGGLETRLEVAGDNTPLVGNRPGDVELLATIDGIPLALPNGRIMLLLRQGEVGKEYLAARISTDNGKTWSEFKKLFNFPSNSKAHYSNGPALVSKSGTIHVFGVEYYNFDWNEPMKSRSYLWTSRSLDGGKTWSPVRRIDFGLN